MEDRAWQEQLDTTTCVPPYAVMAIEASLSPWLSSNRVLRAKSSTALFCIETQSINGAGTTPAPVILWYQAGGAAPTARPKP